MTVYTTVDAGRLHIGIDQYYQGSINSYNNCFTKFFMWLFGRTIDVSIHVFNQKSKSFCLNKKSYNKFLNSHNIASNLNTLQNHRNFPKTAMTRDTTRGYMRDKLSPGKTRKLWQKMVTAIHNKQERRVLKKLGQGAEVYSFFLTRGPRETPVFHTLDIKELMPTGQATTVERVSRLTPYLFARMQDANRQILSDLETFGANTTSRGFTCLFSREILQINTSINHETAMHQNLVMREGRTRSQTTVGIDRVTRQSISYKDSYIDKEDIDGSQANIVRTRCIPDRSEEVWTSTREVGRTSTLQTGINGDRSTTIPLY